MNNIIVKTYFRVQEFKLIYLLIPYLIFLAFLLLISIIIYRSPKTENNKYGFIIFNSISSIVLFFSFCFLILPSIFTFNWSKRTHYIAIGKVKEFENFIDHARPESFYIGDIYFYHNPFVITGGYNSCSIKIEKLLNKVTLYLHQLKNKLINS